MAEGDTILRIARRIDTALAGDALEVSTPNPRGRAARVDRLDGLVLERARSAGKNLLLEFGDLVLHSHLGMSGSWHVYRRGERWRKPARAAWVVMRGPRGEAAQWGGPTLRLLRRSQVALDPRLASLGPDVLDPQFSLDEAVGSIRGTGGDRLLGDALIDQRAIAGIGNIFKSEGCFAAGLDPWRRLEEVDDEELRRVVSETRRLMEEAVDAGRQPRSIYRQAGRPCPACGTRIRSRGQGDANRTTYWCPRCQAGAG
jgi:endonuclease-8